MFTAEKIKELLEDAGYQTTSYVGFGKRVSSLGILTDDGHTIADIVLNIVCQFVSNWIDNYDYDSSHDDLLNKLEELRNIISLVKQDSLGKNIIVYWPELHL